MRILCEAGFNGGLKQTFTLEIRETDTPRMTSGMAGNMTGRHRPDFMLTGMVLQNSEIFFQDFDTSY